MFLTKRKFLLPVAVTVGFLVALLGMRVPNHARPLKSKSNTRAVLEVQTKETKEGLNKAGQLALPHGNVPAFAPAVFYAGSYRNEIPCDTSVLETSAPARAPPLFTADT